LSYCKVLKILSGILRKTFIVRTFKCFVKDESLVGSFRMQDSRDGAMSDRGVGVLRILGQISVLLFCNIEIFVIVV
jgi:hypothetical protein